MLMSALLVRYGAVIALDSVKELMSRLTLSSRTELFGREATPKRR